MGSRKTPQVKGTKEKSNMANNEIDFSRKLKRFCTNRAVLVTAVTLLVVTGVVIAATVSANRAKRPIDPSAAGTGEPTGTQSTPSGVDDVTLPTYNGGETQPVGADPQEPDGMLDLPVSGKLYKGHDATIQVYSNTMGDYRVHLGVDIATAPEAPVYAAADGKVEKVWEDSMMGTCVAVAHKDETVSIYKNLAKDLAEGIAAGAAVKQGQQLGTVGDTAVVEMADEPHLHFEVTVKGLSVNPLDYFSKDAAATLSKDDAYESGATESDTVGTPSDSTAETRPNGK
jgi:murein DD-endopeptidase MepM/ murein hydrolase activator NlpD